MSKIKEKMETNPLIETEEDAQETVRKQLLERGFTLKDDSSEILGFNANVFVKYVMSREKIIYGLDNYFYTYDDGVWIQRNDKRILQYLRDILQEPKYGIWKKRYEIEYIAALEREAYLDKAMNPYKSIINLKNGVFSIKKSKFLPHNSKYLSTIQIPVEYDENASCPDFLKFLNEVFEGDLERIANAQEWFRYALTTVTKAQKALILSGSGANGKGVFVDILSLLVGDGNISNIPLNELSKGFSRVCLYGKTVNISSENESDGKTINTQYFKGIVGEDAITAEQKGKPVFSFKPTVKLILAMNNLPSTRDKSNGFYRRLSILKFNVTFSEANRDENLKVKLRKELPGIFLWAIEGLKRLRKNKFKFSYCESMEQALEEYKTEQNPMIEFFEDSIEEEPSHTVRSNNKSIYETFKTWAEANGHKGYASISSQKFWKQFEAIAKEKGYTCKAGRSNSFR